MTEYDVIHNYDVIPVKRQYSQSSDISIYYMFITNFTNLVLTIVAPFGVLTHWHCHCHCHCH